MKILLKLELFTDILAEEERSQMIIDLSIANSTISSQLSAVQ